MKLVSSYREPIRFGTFELDRRTGELRKNGKKIKLQEQPFQILVMLLEHAGEVVTREELRQRIWPSDTFVDFDHGLYNAIKRLREALGDSAERPRFVETLSRRGYRFIGTPVSGGRSGIGAIAVLPMEILSSDTVHDFFADGLTETLITTLAKISTIRVIARTSVLMYRGSHVPLRDIARQLRVDGLVHGSVMCSGDQVCITAQLIQGDDERVIWAESFQRDMRDVVTLQGELARTIAAQIQVKLSPQEEANLRRERPIEPEAYAEYLKGRYYWNKRTPESMRKGVEHFERAIKIDPSYAAAYSGLADSACALGFWGFAAPEHCGARAKAAAQKAIEIDDSFAEAHASLGWALLHYDFNFVGALREFERAISLDHNCATAAQWYAVTLISSGRSEEAISEMHRATRLDPLSFMINAAFGWVLWIDRHYEQAIAQCKTALELDPNFAPGRFIIGMVYGTTGRYELAIPELEKAAELAGGAANFTTGLAYTYGMAGHAEKARALLQQIEELSKTRYVMAYCRALVHVGLSEKDEAFRWLHRAYDEHSAWMVFTKIDPRLDTLRDDPRFNELLSRLGYPSDAASIVKTRIAS